MEDDSERPETALAAPSPGGIAASGRAGICNGLQAECVAWSEADGSTAGAACVTRLPLSALDCNL